MIKTKLSQNHLSKLAKFEDKLQQLTKIQSQMYERIIHNQKNTMSQLQNSQSHKNKCLKERPQNMRAQTFQQIVKHPVNGQQKGGNGCWMYLANFIQERHDLDDVEKRMLERQKIRNDLEQIKREERDKQEQTQRKLQEERLQKQGLLDGKWAKNSKNTKGKSQQKIPFNLQRQLHRKEVEENRKRLQKIQAYKKESYLQSHNYY